MCRICKRVQFQEKEKEKEEEEEKTKRRRERGGTVIAIHQSKNRDVKRCGPRAPSSNWISAIVHVTRGFKKICNQITEMISQDISDSHPLPEQPKGGGRQTAL